MAGIWGAVLAVPAQGGSLSAQAQQGAVGRLASAQSQKAFPFQPCCPEPVVNASR